MHPVTLISILFISFQLPFGKAYTSEHSIYTVVFLLYDEISQHECWSFQPKYLNYKKANIMLAISKINLHVHL